MQSACPIEKHGNIPAEKFAPLADVVCQHSSIKHALDWLQSHTPPLSLSDILTQDEFSHDILIAYPGELWLVYDCT